MASTIDNYTVKVNAEGVQTLDQVNAKLSSIDESAKKTAQAMNQVRGGVQNVAYQIQDLAVQIGMGTNVFMALGQQLPQLLSGFGTMGVVIGAVAAVAIPLFQAGLKAAGVDMRNLAEMTKDLTESTTRFLEAQRQNQSTLVGMGNSYGILTEEAKKFFEIKQQILQIKTEDENSRAVKELVKDYGFLTEVRLKDATARAESGKNLPYQGAMVTGAELAGLQLRVKWLGLTTEQAVVLGEKLKGLDQASPEKTVSAISDILSYLKETGPQTESFRREFEKVIDPLMKVNEELIRQKTNIKESTQQASNFAASMMLLQSSAMGDVNAARRNFDQIGAARREATLKAAEFDLQITKRENETGTKLDAERTAFRIKNQQELNDKIKDFTKGQQETFYAQQLGNERKRDELDLQRKIGDLQLGQLDSVNYQSVLEERVLKNIFDQQQSLAAIFELRRKNQISAEQQRMLEEQVSGIRKQSDAAAEQAIKKQQADNERNLRIQVEGLATQNSIKERSIALEGKIFGLSSLRQDTEKKLFDIQNSRDREIANINNNARLSDAEKLDALIRINEQYQRSKDLAEEEYKYRKQLSENFNAGAQDKIRQITESFDQFKTAGMMVDSVWGNMSSALDNFVETGKFRFGDFARSIIFDLEKIALKSAVIGLFKSYGLGDIFSLPGRAAGGPVSSNTPYMVGEAGPELFIPNTSGNIVPNSKLGGGTTIINNNISAIDAKSVAQLFAENRMTLLGTVESARRELPMRTR